MAKTVVVAQSLDIPVGQPEAFSRMLPMNVLDLLNRWYGPFPPVKAVQPHSDGPWGAVGQSRTLGLAGPGSLVETLTAVEGPERFAYTLTDIKGPMRIAVDHVEAEWRFTPAGDGTRVVWQWTVHPRNAVVKPFVHILCRTWRGYARQSLRTLSAYLLRRQVP